MSVPLGGSPPSMLTLAKETEVRVAGPPGTCRAVYHRRWEFGWRVCALRMRHLGSHDDKVGPTVETARAAKEVA